MKTPVQPARSRRGKWIAFVLLLALAAIMYASIVIKVTKFGF